MNEKTPTINVRDLKRSYGKTDAVNGLNLRVQPGRCYGLFGRNGAGKTTTIKCLLNLLKPASGSVELFGMNPQRHEVAVKERLAYVPDQVACYPWMTIQSYFEYLASFRKHWNLTMQNELIGRFDLAPGRKVNDLSRGQKVQVALIGALCPEPQLLILDEPTSGLDPQVRREFIRTVIGAYQEGDPENRTVFVSTHLITEFEGLIDEFTVMEKGRDILTMPSEDARDRFKKIRVRFADEPPPLDELDCIHTERDGREVEIYCNDNSEQLMESLQACWPQDISLETLSLEEIFLTSLKLERKPHEPAHS